jgi:hypothetical protein
MAQLHGRQACAKPLTGQCFLPVEFALSRKV